MLFTVYHGFAAEKTDSLKNTGKAWVEIMGMAATTQQTPFWMQANTWGTVPSKVPAGVLRAGVEHVTYFRNEQWKLSTGAEGVINISEGQTRLLLPQAYLSIHYGKLRVGAGRRQLRSEVAGDEIGSGSVLFSSNTLPVPMAGVSLDDYVPIPFTGKWVHFKASYADGWFERGRTYTSALKLHRKSMYLNIGKPTSAVHLVTGFDHAVQWGGWSPFETLDGQMPSGWKAYKYAVTGIKPKGKISGGTFDNTNRVGNHVASLDVLLSWDKADWRMEWYRQHLVEDGSLYYLSGLEDGLNGFLWASKRKKSRGIGLESIVAEFLYTKDQGGDEFSTSNRGRDNYFNNAQVRDGWSYFGRTIGTPFITPNYSNLIEDVGSTVFTNNNRVAVWHLGLSGHLGGGRWMVKLSRSSNIGTYSKPFPEEVRQFSGLLSVAYPTNWLGKNTEAGFRFAMDKGKLFEDSMGMMLWLRKSFVRTE